MLYIKKFISLVIILQMWSFSVLAAEAAATQSELNLQEIALPSEVKDLNKSTGSIYYSTSVKNKVLIPVHIWGEVRQAGLHFIPSDTTFVKGISLAGGPSGSAKLDEIVLIRKSAGENYKEVEFDLSKGGDATAHQFKIEPGDTIFIKKDTFMENRAYYTSWIGILITVISTFVIVNKVK
ncbi:MAG: SLBB domain-containing protein [Bacteriovorax sp.]|jgi:hypothetical protein